MLLAVVLSFGASGSASAAKGDNGQGKKQGNSASQSQKTDPASTQDRGTASSADRPQREKAQPAKAQPQKSQPQKSQPQKAPAARSQSDKGNRAKSDHSQGTAGTSGEYDEPQPISNADANQGGANGQCPGGAYCSTRDGSESKNGNGGGKATGKPCAGCVGKADNKNPRGQRPDGTDHNNGYECDGNNGIGKTNPAHTGCATDTNEPPPCEPKPGEDKDCNPVEQPCVETPDAPCDEGEQPCVETPDAPCDEGEQPCVETPDAPCDEEQGGPDGPVTTSTSLTTSTSAAVPSSLTTPPVLAGVQQVRTPQAASPSVVTAQLPQTGAGDLLQLLTAAGLALALAGGTTLLMQRRVGTRR